MVVLLVVVLFCWTSWVKNNRKTRAFFLFALMGHKPNYKIKTCFNRSCEKSKPTRNSQTLTKNSKRFVRPVGSKIPGKSGRFFNQSGHKSNYKIKSFWNRSCQKSEPIRNYIHRLWREPRLGEMDQEALKPRISKCHKENVWYFSKDLEGLQIGENGPGGTGPI